MTPTSFVSDLLRLPCGIDNVRNRYRKCPQEMFTQLETCINMQSQLTSLRVRSPVPCPYANEFEERTHGEGTACTRKCLSDSPSRSISGSSISVHKPSTVRPGTIEDGGSLMFAFECFGLAVRVSGARRVGSTRHRLRFAAVNAWTAGVDAICSK